MSIATSGHIVIKCHATYKDWRIMDKIVYENSHWKLVADGKTWTFEANHYSKYWIYVDSVMVHDYMFDHVAEKTWCSLLEWGDVCRKASELSPYKVKYDLKKKISEVEIWKNRSASGGKGGCVARPKGIRLLKPSETCD
jgi:hypothetical protein